jgi:pyridoxine 4-dehydrogenase
VTLEQIEQARQIVPIVSVQNKFSISDRTNEDVLNYCTQNDLAFIPHGSLGAHPLKNGAPLANAEGIIADIAVKKGVKPNQIALAWLLHRASNIILIPGTTTIGHLKENMAAGSINLTTEEITMLDRLQIL